MPFEPGSAGTFVRRKSGEPLRVLLCLGVRDSWYDADRTTRDQVLEAVEAAFSDLHGQFGFHVIGTFDDDQIVVGPSNGWPWTAYVLGDAPDLDTVVSVCNLVRDTQVGDFQLWKYFRIEARLGHELFFAKD